MRRLALFLAYVILPIACHFRPGPAAASGDANARDAAGYTPLIAAARAGKVATIRLLTSRGADPNLRDAAVTSWTPLLHAVHKAQPGSVIALLDGGANPNGADANGTTPLMMAAGYGYTDIVKLLLVRGANPRLATRDGVTAIDLARSGVPDIDRFTVFTCQDDTVKALLVADPKLPDHTANLPGIAGMLMHTKRCGA